MTIDARSLPVGHIIDADVCIIGAGVAGLTIGRSFIGCDATVCVLEQGGEDADSAVQPLNRGEVTGYPYWGLDYARHAQVGGASHRWVHDLGKRGTGARFMPLERIDFEKRSVIPYSGWPFSKDDLEPYYGRAQALFYLGPNSYSARDWAKREDDLFITECPSLRSRIMQYGPKRPFTEIYPTLIGDAKNVTLIHHARVQELVAHKDGKAVSYVRFVNPGGMEMAVRATTYVLAAGGIGNPHLLLLSDRVHPDGLGNQNDLVGRFLMEHAHFRSGIVRPANSETFEFDTFYRPHRRDGTFIQGTIVLSEDVLRREGLRNFASELWRTFDPGDRLYDSEAFEAVRILRSTLRSGYLPDRFLSKVWTVFRKSTPFVRHWISRTRKQLKNELGIPTPPVAYILHHVSEQAPNPESRIRRSRHQVDRFGQSRPEFHLKYTDEDIGDVLRGLEIYKRELERTGRWRVELKDYDHLPPPGIRGGFHHMGTTRMNENPRRGVVDANGRVHGVSNLFVAGSSVFPTGGCANPTLTIGALSLRLADYLKTRSASISNGSIERPSDEEIRDGLTRKAPISARI